MDKFFGVGLQKYLSRQSMIWNSFKVISSFWRQNLKQFQPSRGSSSEHIWNEHVVARVITLFRATILSYIFYMYVLMIAEFSFSHFLIFLVFSIFRQEKVSTDIDGKEWIFGALLSSIIVYYHFFHWAKQFNTYQEPTSRSKHVSHLSLLWSSTQLDWLSYFWQCFPK